jgi:hypothetical protein
MFELKLGAVELTLGEPSTVGVARPSLLDTSDTLSASMSVSLAPGRGEKMDVRTLIGRQYEVRYYDRKLAEGKDPKAKKLTPAEQGAADAERINARNKRLPPKPPKPRQWDSLLC